MAQIVQHSALLNMPAEILSRVLEFLPLVTCNTLREILNDNPFHKLYEDRVSLEQYFSKNLCNGKRMMDILRRTDGYVYASRALQYFIPGSITDISDWNFCLPKDPKKIQYFMKSMEDMGVEWETFETRLMKLFSTRTSFIVRTEKLLQVLRAIDTTDLDNEEKEEIFDIIHNAEARGNEKKSFTTVEYEIGTQDVHYCTAGRIDNDDINRLISRITILNVTDSTYDVDFEKVSDNKMNVVHGYINHGASKIKITLVQYIVNNPTEGINSRFLLHEPITTSQCFISGFGAGNMYSQLSQSSIAVKWISNRKLDCIHPDILCKKYKARGYDVHNKLFEEGRHQYAKSNERNTLDNQSMFIKVDRDIGWDSENWDMAQTSLCYIPWREYTSRVEFTIRHKPEKISNYSTTRYSRFRNSLLPSSVDSDYLLQYNITL